MGINQCMLKLTNVMYEIDSQIHVQSTSAQTVAYANWMKCERLSVDVARHVIWSFALDLQFVDPIIEIIPASVLYAENPVEVDSKSLLHTVVNVPQVTALSLNLFVIFRMMLKKSNIGKHPHIKAAKYITHLFTFQNN